MRILYLGYSNSLVYTTLLQQPNHIVTSNIDVDIYPPVECDLVISYGWRKIIRPNFLNICRCINLHISYLPWNRGAYPVLWSIWNQTPYGITIHNMSKKIDEGDILLQKKIIFPDTYTLRDAYNYSKSKIEQLFIENLDDILYNKIEAVPQFTVEPTHKAAEIDRILEILPKKWDTTIVDIFKIKVKNEILH